MIFTFVGNEEKYRRSTKGNNDHREEETKSYRNDALIQDECADEGRKVGYCSWNYASGEADNVLVEVVVQPLIEHTVKLLVVLLKGRRVPPIFIKFSVTEANELRPHILPHMVEPIKGYKHHQRSWSHTPEEGDQYNSQIKLAIKT